MALTGTLLADFSAFIKEALSAKNATTDLQQSGDAAAKTLSQLGSGVDMKKAITDPMGTATAAVKSFGTGLVESMGSTGIAIAGMTAVGGVLGEKLIEIGNEAEAVGQSIGRMGVMFNIPVAPLSDLRFAITAAGGDFDSFGNSMFTFQKRLEDNGDAVSKGLDKIGLSLESIRGMRPDEQFLAISDALRDTGTETNKSAVAFEIFGRQGRDMLPLLLKPLSDLTEESEKLGATWSQTDVDAARAFGAAQKKMGAETEEAWTSVGRTVAPITNDIVLGWDRMKLAAANVALTAVESFQITADALRHLLGSTGDLELKQEEAAAVQSAVIALYKQAADAGLDYADQTDQVARKMLEMNYSHQTVQIALGLTAEKVRELASEQRNATKDADEYNALWADINKKMTEGKPSIEGVDAATRGLVKDMNDAGVSTDKMAKATGLTKEQIDLLKKSLDDATAALKKWNEANGNANTAAQGWQTTLDELDGTVVEAMKYDLSLGVSQADVATRYQATAAQVAAVKISLDDYIASINTAADFEQDAGKRRIEITHQMTEATNAQILAKFKAQQAEADFYMGTEAHAKAAQQETLTTAQMQTATQDQLNANLAKAQANFASAANMTDEELIKLGLDLETLQGKASQAFYYAQLVPNGMSKGVEEVSGAVTKAGETVGSSFEQGYGRAQQASSNFRNSSVADAAAVAAAAAAATAVWETAQGRIDAFNAKQAANPSNVLSTVGMFGGMSYVQTRDSGGPVVAGTPYLIGGGKDPELFVPGASGYVTPGAKVGAGGGVSVTNVFNIVDTEANITRRVSDNITRSIMAAQKL
jgi:hypothetical protein